MNRTALILAAVALAFIVISNTVGDGNTLGGIAFLVWVLALLGAIVLGVRGLIARNKRP